MPVGRSPAQLLNGVKLGAVIRIALWLAGPYTVLVALH
jgi:hypothetical protein